MEHSTRSSLDSTSDQEEEEEEEEDDFAGILFPPPEDEDEKVAQRLLVNDTVAATSEEWRRRREGAVMDTGGQEAWIYMLIEFYFSFYFFGKLPHLHDPALRDPLPVDGDVCPVPPRPPDR